MTRSTAKIIMLTFIGSSSPAEVEPDILAAVVRIHSVIEAVIVQVMIYFFAIVTKLQLSIVKVLVIVEEAAIVTRVVHLWLKGSSAN